MHSSVLHIGLSSWIVQDGNYADFECGTTRQFALEFYSDSELTADTRDPKLTHIQDGKYQATGIVRFCADNVWIVDFGGVLAFREESPPHGFLPGVTVSGVIHFGVDPFFYFERLSKVPGIPSLIYTWQIEEIAIETAPFIEIADPFGRMMMVRDQTKLRRVPIVKTDAWKDDNGMADYLLTCRNTGAPVSKRFEEAH